MKKTARPARGLLLILLILPMFSGATGTGVAVAAPAVALNATVPVAGAAPETVVVLHGLGRNKSSMWLLASRFEAAGFRVQRIGYRSLHEDPAGILVNLRAQIDACCARSEQPVHFVGHSLGGLLIRAYLASKPVKQLGRVVLIGSPSQGTPIVDTYRDKWWMKYAGPTAAALGTGENSFPKSLPPPDYPLGVIAGKSDRLIDYPAIPGDDDGLVPVDSTKVKGMQDFVVIRTTHSMLRYNEQTAAQAIAFLKFGQFIR